VPADPATFHDAAPHETAPLRATPSGGAGPVAVREAVPGDAPALATLAALTFPLACPPSTTPAGRAGFIAAHLSPERFAEYLADPARHLLLAPGPDGRPLGYTMLALGEPSDEEAAAAIALRPAVELSKCYVHPVHHGTGVAAALMAASLEAARDAGATGIWLGVNRHNLRAQAFYAKSGFAVVGTKHFLVGDTLEDDFVMERPL